MLDERQIKAVHLMANGENISDISRILNVSRQTIYDWKEKDEFVAELDRCIQRIKVDADKKLTSNLKLYVTELEKIAFNSKNEKIKSNCLMYLIDRVLGKCTSKADINIDNEVKEDISWDSLSNVVELKEVK